jgi:hypothetical protein
MGNVDPRDGFDVWVIDPANGTVEQVEFDTVPPERQSLPSEVPAATQPCAPVVPVPPAAPAPRRIVDHTAPEEKKKRQPRKPGMSSKAGKESAATKTVKNPGTEKKRRPQTTASGKRRANPRKRVRAKARVLVGVGVAEAAAATPPSKPTTRTPRPIRKRITPSKSKAPASVSAATPAAPAPVLLPAPRQPVLVASANDLVKPAPANPADVLMVLELVCGGPARATGEPPRRGSIDIRYVDVHE